MEYFMDYFIIETNWKQIELNKKWKRNNTQLKQNRIQQEIELNWIEM